LRLLLSRESISFLGWFAWADKARSAEPLMLGQAFIVAGKDSIKRDKRLVRGLLFLQDTFSPSSYAAFLEF
jgi:hypothetical protein